MDDIDKLKRTLGAGLLSAREQAGLTQADVASRAGITPAIYGRIERGQMLPSVPTLCKLCAALNVPANQLIGLSLEEMTAGAALLEADLPPELRRLAELLRTLSPSELRTLAALAAVIAR